MPPELQNTRWATDGRMRGKGPSGVATYARGLRRAQQTMDAGSLLLCDDHAIASIHGDRRWHRWVKALWPGARTAKLRRDGDGAPVDLHAPDIFRVAQVYFDVHGRPLRVRAPGPSGIMHWSYPVPLLLEGWINLYTVHDVIPLLHPSLTPIDPRRHRRLLRAIIRPAAALVTVSDAARDDILRMLECDPAMITNCGQAVEAAPMAALPAGLVPRSYLLVCGSVEPRKNIGGLVEGFRRSGTTLPLVVAGPDGWRSEEFGLDAPDIVRLRNVDAGTIAALIGNARMLLMPSLAEGFGLPVAEAMALGTPVVTSSGGALAETAGGAALLVDPHDSDAIADAIRRMADDGLRRKLVELGLRNADRFSPDRFAARLTALYAGLVERNATGAYATR